MNFYNQYLQGIQKKKKKRIQHPSPSTQGMHLDEKCRTAELVTTVTVTGSTVSVISSTTQFLSPTSGLLTWRNVFVIDRHSALLRLCELNFVMNMLSWIPWQHVWLYRISSIFTQMLHLRLPKKKKKFPCRSCVGTSHSKFALMMALFHRKFAQKSLGTSACTEHERGNQQSPSAGRVCMNKLLPHGYKNNRASSQIGYLRAGEDLHTLAWVRYFAWAHSLSAMLSLSTFTHTWVFVGSDLQYLR